MLKDKNIAEFDDVKIVFNQPESIVREAIDEFFDRKKSDDMLLLYFSGHGIRDEMGALYLALKNTNLLRLRATGIKSDFIREAMDQSYSKRQILILDCCNSGAFAQGTKASVGGSIGTATAFKGNGYGRVILTASDATQFAWEGNRVIGETQNSLFTHFLIEGIKGNADKDGDGKITIDDLYEYAYEQTINKNPKQTPGKWSYSQKGELIIRQSTGVDISNPINLPDGLEDAINDARTWVREGAIHQLEKLLNQDNLNLARSARTTLEKIVIQDDSKSVSQMAQKVLDGITNEKIMKTDSVVLDQNKKHPSSPLPRADKTKPAKKILTGHRDWIKCSNCKTTQYRDSVSCVACKSVFEN